MTDTGKVMIHSQTAALRSFIGKKVDITSVALKNRSMLPPLVTLAQSEIVHNLNLDSYTASLILVILLHKMFKLSKVLICRE